MIRSATQLPGGKKNNLIKKSSQGNASMEYIIVSCFALIVSMTAVSWLGKLLKERITAMAERMNVDTSDLDLDLGADFGRGE